MRRLIKRCRMALAFRVWPWRVPWQAAHYLKWPPTVTESDVRWARELAALHGWDTRSNG